MVYIAVCGSFHSSFLIFVQVDKESFGKAEVLVEFDGMLARLESASQRLQFVPREPLPE